MDRRRFFTSGIGAALWVGVVTLLGYFLSRAFPVLQDKLDVAILLVVAVSLVPAAFEWWRHRRTRDPRPDTPPDLPRQLADQRPRTAGRAPPVVR